MSAKPASNLTVEPSAGPLLGQGALGEEALLGHGDRDEQLRALQIEAPRDRRRELAMLHAEPNAAAEVGAGPGAVRVVREGAVGLVPVSAARPGAEVRGACAGTREEPGEELVPDSELPGQRAGGSVRVEPADQSLQQRPIDRHLSRKIPQYAPRPHHRPPARQAREGDPRRQAASALLPSWLLLVCACLLAACPTASEQPPEPTPEPTPEPLPDLDGDGVPDELDCAPANATVFPGAEELCDGLDTDCDGTLPDDESDDDVDGSLPCEGDCDDNDPALYGSDYDADGSSTCAGDCDDYDPAVEGLDFDADGQSTCEGDCDDHDPDNFLGNPEVDACDGIDNDCVVDLDELDRDADGYRPCEGDCADLNKLAYPGRPEVCDVVDNDCNGLKDDGLVVPAQWPSDGLFDAVALSVAQFHPETPDDVLGQSIASGDVNGDGYGDLIIASNNDDEPWRNATYVIHGPFCGEATVGDPAEGVVNWRQQAAQSTSTIGDVNNDGYDDVRTFAAVRFGPLSGEGDELADWGLYAWGPTHGDFKMKDVGDLNGDGIDDIAVGEDAAPWTWDPVTESWGLGPGRVAIFWGPVQPGGVSTEDADAFLTVDPTWWPQQFGAEFTPGDFDGDGLTDLAITSRTPTFTTYIAYGPFTDGVRNLDQDPEASKIDGGILRLAATDLDGDGADELAMAGHSIPGETWLATYGGPIPRGSNLPVSAADWGESPTSAGGWIDTFILGGASCFLFQARGLSGIPGSITSTSFGCGGFPGFSLVGVFEDVGAYNVGDLNGDGQPDLLARVGDVIHIILGPTPQP